MPKLNLEDTIAAVATPPGEGGIAVIRVSGKQAIQLSENFFRSAPGKKLSVAPSHTIHHGQFVDEKGELADEVLISVFRSPHSYTGEDVVEISCHGGIKITGRILEILIKDGARYAEPGEFTKRAFLHGKMDLTQAEAVLDLIRARSDQGLQMAVEQLAGGLSKKINGLKHAMIKISAHFEASLDFPDERLEVYSKKEFLAELEAISQELSSLIGSFKRTQTVREGVLAVILGRPNVGKSSLLNMLLTKDRALVSALPGTTRDALEESIEVGGTAIRLVDTAGLGSSKDPLDQMGMDRTRDYLKDGKVFLFIIDGSRGWTLEDETILSELKGKNYILVVNKIDLPQNFNFKSISHLMPDQKPIFVSCLKQQGIEELEKVLQESIRSMNIVLISGTLTRARHKQAFERALDALRRAKKSFEDGLSGEFILEDLKIAVESLQELIGEVYSEDLLDVIFQEFCIGK